MSPIHVRMSTGVVIIRSWLGNHSIEISWVLLLYCVYKAKSYNRLPSPDSHFDSVKMEFQFYLYSPDDQVC